MSQTGSILEENEKQQKLQEERQKELERQQKQKKMEEQKKELEQISQSMWGQLDSSIDYLNENV